ncbi:response regulator transcription factor [Pseudomonas helleri]|uniref:response regulator transcription factor n=1 Tax=Pseudomonas helleri TaxID=1608996 RepID=UPI0028F022BB|nr:response regulator transcription factor [Pseudomonas helleri]
MSQRIILADDHPVVLTGIRMTLNSAFCDAIIVSEARSTDELIQQLKHHPCDLLITDFSMPNGKIPDGIRLISYIRRHFPRTKVIIITMINNPFILTNLLKLGVSGLFDKRQPLELLIHAITRTSMGSTYISETFSDIQNPLSHDNNPHPPLSLCELEVVRLISQNYTGREIAKVLNRSEKTISRHKRAAMQKLGTRYVSDLASYVQNNGLGNVQP